MEADDEPRQLEQLRREIADVRASRRRIVLTDDDARKDIERDFHTGVQQRLVGLAAGLQLAEDSLDRDPVATKALLVEIGIELGRTIQHARSIANRIHPPLLEIGGLAPALRTAAAEANVRTKLNVPGGTAPEPELASMVYFCCLDVFERVAPGTTVSVNVLAEDAPKRFEIVVDGALDAGWFPARDRIEALGGRLTLGPDAQGRARIVGSVPS